MAGARPAYGGGGLTGLTAAFAALFVLSGAAGLTYEVVWSRHLVQVFGVTAFAVSTVLVSFMGGLALGAALLGATASRVRRPLRLFAVLEASIGAYALMLPALLGILEQVHDSILPRIGGAFFLHSMIRFVLCLGVLLVPTVLMGGTLPALGQGLLRRPERISVGAGVLYFVNTLGAAAGCYLAGFHLIPTLGLRATTGVAVAVNGAVALSAWLLGGLAQGEAARAVGDGRPPGRPTEPATVPAAWPLAVAFGSGVLALLFEVVWFRVLVLVFGSTVYSFSAMLSIFLLGLALGSVLAGSLADRSRRPARLLAAAQGWVALSVLAGSLAVNQMPYLYLRILDRLGADFAGVNRTKLLMSSIVLIPPALGFGATFPLAVRLWRPGESRAGSRIGGVYAWNTVGAILGSFGAGFVLVPAIGAEWVLKLVVAGGMLLAFGTLLAERGPLEMRWALPAGAALLAMLGALVGAPGWDRRLLGVGVYYLPHGVIDREDPRRSVDRAVSGFRLVTYTEGYSDTITSFETQQGKVITVNGSATASTDFVDMFSQRLMGHLPMALHPGPARKVCVVGLGAGVTAGAIATHQPQELLVIELERGVLQASRFFEKENHRVLDAPATKVAIDDGVIHLRLTGERFDVISSHPNFPALTGSGTLFSKEYFEACRARLAPGGIVCHYAPLWRLAPEDLKVILASFAAVFPHVRVFNTGLSLVLLGRIEPFPPVDVHDLARRAGQPEVAASLRAVGVRGPIELLSFYQLDEGELRALTLGAPLNTADFPRVEFRAPRSVFAQTVGLNLEELHRVRPPLEELASRLGLTGEDRSSYLSLAADSRAVADAEIAFSQGQVEEGLALLGPVADSGHAYARHLLAIRAEQFAQGLLAAGRLEAAREHFALAARHDPARLESLLGLAWVDASLGRPAEAESVLAEAVVRHPRSAAALAALASVRESRGDAQGAESLYRQAIALEPSQAGPLARLGSLLQRTGRGEEGLRFLDGAIDLGERAEEVMLAKGEALLALERHGEALRWARTAVREMPSSERVLSLLERSAAAAGRTQEAAEAARRRDELRTAGRGTAPGR